MILNCVIIEDENHAIELLTDHIQNMPNLSLLKVYSQPITAMTEITEEDNIDIIFLDINMPGMSGMDLAKILRPKTRFLLFTTAYHQYAVEAFELEADQYIIKPVTFPKFIAAIEKIIKKIGKSQSTVLPKSEIFIKTGVLNKVTKVNPADVVYLEARDNYIIVHTDKDSIITYLTLKEALHTLNQLDNLLQVQKSFVIAKNKIEIVEGNVIIMDKGIQIPIGNTYRKSFFDYVKKNTVVSGRVKPPKSS
ncbi:DNA-binding LytR/AlgR family response regulator [Pedobacter cryoconitis]|uniref:DNA-binding LytR/AlgR family response regulator n=1 Tax=Pedobacter cryoconitis TaxID=188932 RepID=A0A7W9DXZ0_9SPHI|nr:response regulator transcription factor [Pedobacter cryoconitis]MBB5635361.1 DNA-binding LytR/AlgR family response regulator [Pedobacter cryoconitis]MBB6273777.1 DNA-binding LytR/AlgR family response regulator [Pedobacter cryoconitis]